MKRKLSVLIFTIISVFTIFANSNDSLIEAAINDDYQTFEELVKSKAKSKLNEITYSGMTLQCALTYFSDDNFEKACKLLNSKKFDFNKPTDHGITLAYVLSYSYSYNKLKILLKYNPKLDILNSSKVSPIDSTQFGTFKFYSEQKFDDSNFDKAEAIRELLKQNGSPNFKQLPINVYYFGNLQICLFSCFKTLIPSMQLQDFNTEDLFIFSNTNGQDWATLNKQGIIDFMKDYGVQLEVEEYYSNKDDIVQQIKKTYESEYLYFVIFETGNNPVCPYQWVYLKDISNPSVFNNETSLICHVPDTNYSFMRYKIKDISTLITIKVKK